MYWVWILVLIPFLLITPVFAELTTDKANYSVGETVIINGVAPLGVEEYTFELIDPDDEIMAIGQFELWEEREYRFEIPVGGQLFTDSGIFTVIITYDNGEKDQTIFGFETLEQTTPKPEPSPSPLPDRVHVRVPAGSSVPGCEETDECWLPSVVTVDVGGEVTWSNDDTAAHTVTSGTPADGPNGIFDSSLFMAGQTYSVTFDEDATYDYFCMVHPWMAGTVIVGEGGPVTPIPTPTPPRPTPIPTPTPVDTTDVIASRGSSVPGCEETSECFIPSTVKVNLGDTVNWFNRDFAAHTVTSGTTADGPNGIFDSSLFMAGTTFSHTFDEEGTFDYFCMVHPWMSGIVVVGEGGPIPPPRSDISISVEAERSIYDLGDLVKIDVFISGISYSERVAVTVTDRAGTAVISRTLTTDSSGHAELEFRIPEDFRTGTYVISATTSIDGITYKASDVFKIQSQFDQIRIVSVEPTDQRGNPSDFETGQLGFVKVVLDANKDIAVLITVNLFDSDLTSIGIGSLKTTLNEGDTEMILSFMIPNDTALGQGEIFSSFFSDWPSDGGIPITNEVKAGVNIE